MIIAVDFDGTISTHDTFPRVPEPNEIREGAWEILRKLSLEGHTLILWTCRHNRYLRDAIELCNANGVKFDAYNDSCKETYEEFGWAGVGVKASADVYIDDKGINGIPDTWYEIYENLMNR